MEIYQNGETILNVIYCVNGQIEVSILQGYNEIEKTFTGSFALDLFNDFISKNEYKYITTK